MNRETLLPCIEIDPSGPVHASVIWLHGLGADGHDFEPLVPELQLAGSGLRFILPHAPQRPVTLNGGYVMRAWYDLYALDLSAGEDEAGIRASEAELRSLIERERAAGIPAERIFLAGFSQGGAVVLHTGLRYPEALGGVLALSTYLPLRDHAAAEHHPANAALPLFMAHGRFDEVIPISAGERSRAELERLGCRVEWHEYPMAHSVCGEEVTAICGWLERRLASSSVSPADRDRPRP